MIWTNVFHYSGQLLLVIAAAELLLIVLRVREAHLRLRVLQSALLLCLLLPFAQPRRVNPIDLGALRARASQAALADEAPHAAATSLLTTLWGTGCAFLLLRIAAGLAGLQRLRLRSKAFAFRGDVPVRLATGLASPVAFGIFRPIVLLPEQAETLDPITLEPMIAHELAHIARRDWAFVLAEELVRAALWFHPGIWWLLDRIRAARELAVDATVTAATGAEAYSESLLTAAHWRTSTSPHQPLTAIAMYRGGSLRRRLQLIQKPSGASNDPDPPRGLHQRAELRRPRHCRAGDLHPAAIRRPAGTAATGSREAESHSQSHPKLPARGQGTKGTRESRA